MNEEEIVLGWARNVTKKQAWLLHPSTLAIGPVDYLYDGITEKFESIVDGVKKPVDVPVLRLASGHTLIANPNAFVELSEQDVGFYNLAMNRFTDFVTGGVVRASELKVDGPMAITLLRSILTAQLIALETIDRKAMS